MKKIKLKKKHGIIMGVIVAVASAVAMTAHLTHFPILLLAFFGFVGAGMIESPVFKIIMGLMSVMSIFVLIRMYKRKKNKGSCPHKSSKIEKSNEES